MEFVMRWKDAGHPFFPLYSLILCTEYNYTCSVIFFMPPKESTLKKPFVAKSANISQLEQRLSHALQHVVLGSFDCTF